MYKRQGQTIDMWYTFKQNEIDWQYDDSESLDEYILIRESSGFFESGRRLVYGCLDRMVVGMRHSI